MRIPFSILFIAATATSCIAADIKRIDPVGLQKPNRYSHVVIAKGEKTIYIAGQVAADAAGNVVGKGDLAAQTDKALQNLKIALAAAGATFADVVKMTYFIVNLKPSMMPPIRSVRDKYFPSDFPAGTAVGVQALAGEDYLIEIEAVAVI
jgi:enamine deaminase RidA (YjgF/YER057c/UK114 family)